MFSSVLLFALSGYLTQATFVVPPESWHNDYTSALDRAVQDKKPIAIIVGNGIKGWQQVSKQGELSTEVRKLFEGHYVCVYLDTGTERGQKMAGALNVGAGPALIIGDRSGTNQAFRYKGSLTDEQLANTLKRFAKVGEVASETEFSVAEPARAAAQTQRPYYNYQNYAPSSFSFGGGGC